MSNRLFSDEEVEMLRMNPCVKNVTSRYVEFTPEFKQKIYDELIGGARIRDILLRHGIDPNVLGEARIRGLQQKIEKQAGRPEGFQNLKRSGQKPATSREKTLEKQVRELQHQLAYTQQEVEFLKKIRMADLEAQKQWESKRRQK